MICMAIIGGGLAGLGAANALAHFGIEAEVFEAAPALGEVGAAVNIAPNAARALAAIGLAEKIAAAGSSSPGIYTRNMQTGEFLEFNDRRKTAAWVGAPYYTFHRADLLDVLASGARSRPASSRPQTRRHRGAWRRRAAGLRQRRRARSRIRDRSRRGTLGHPPSALRPGQSDLYRADGLARAA